MSASAFAQVSIKNAWIRNTVEGQKVTSAFMQLTAQENGKLLGFSSSIAARIEMHETRKSNNVMRMRAVESVNLPAGEMVEFTSGSYHLMLYGLKKKLRVGDDVPLTLTFENKDKNVKSIDFTAKVRDAFVPAKTVPMHH